MLMFCSSMMTGSHDATQLPVVIDGRRRRRTWKPAGCSIIADKPNRKMCSLYLSLMDKFGVSLESFGDSTERLAEV